MATLQSYLAELADLPDFVELGPVNPHTRGNFGNTPLHVAAVRGELDALGWLLDADADINVTGEHGYTPLHDAVEQHQREAVVFCWRVARHAASSTPTATLLKNSQSFATISRPLLSCATMLPNNALQRTGRASGVALVFGV